MKWIKYIHCYYDTTRPKEIKAGYKLEKKLLDINVQTTPTSLQTSMVPNMTCNPSKKLSPMMMTVAPPVVHPSLGLMALIHGVAAFQHTWKRSIQLLEPDFNDRRLWGREWKQKPLIFFPPILRFERSYSFCFSCERSQIRSFRGNASPLNFYFVSILSLERIIIFGSL